MITRVFSSLAFLVRGSFAVFGRTGIRCFSRTVAEGGLVISGSARSSVKSLLLDESLKSLIDVLEDSLFFVSFISPPAFSDKNVLKSGSAGKHAGSGSLDSSDTLLRSAL